jgi:uncharacterized protein with PQ loop repeat
MPTAIHHIHQRKRQHQLSTYPHPVPWVRFLDQLLVGVAIIAPLMVIPQIYMIISTKSAIGVSPLTWGLFALFNIPWLVYGIVHKEKPIIIGYILWLLVNSTVVILTLIYS